MKHFICGIKAASDAALWLSIVCGILSFYFEISNLFLLIVLAFIFSLVGSMLRSKGLVKYSSLLAFTPAILIIKTEIDLLISLPIVAYLLFCLIKDILYPEYMQLEDIFPKTGIIILFMCFVMGFREIFWIFALCLMYLILMVFMMRSLRHEELNSKNLNIMEISVMAVLCLLCFVLSRPEAIGLITAFSGFIYEYVVSPILTLFLMIIYGLVWVISKAGSLLIRDTRNDDVPFFGRSFMGLTEEALENLRVNEGNAAILVTILKIIGVLLFIGISILLIRWFLGSMKKTGTSKEVIYNMTESFRFVPEYRESVKITDRTPKAKVRRAYRDFIEAINDFDVQIARGDTSLDINELAAEKVDKEKSEKLREIYIMARYNPSADIPPEEVKLARSLSKSLQKDIRMQLREIKKSI